VSKKDYYALLWVTSSSSEDEIKKAYRKLAMQYHPDRNPGNHESEAKFKEINEAYSVLGDPSKRSQYDRFGSVGDNPFSWFGWGDVDISDIFEGIFGGGFSQARKKWGARKGEDLEYQMKIDLKTSIYGGKETISFERYEDCIKCDGAWGSGKVNCQKCRGTGYIKYRQQSFFWTIESSAVCDECQGSGETFQDVCNACHGKKRTKQTVDIDIQIPAGIDDGMIIKMTSEGNAWIGTKSRGDLYIKFHVDLKEKELRREDIDLYYTCEIDLLEAILGNEKECNIPIIGKRKIKIPAGTQFGTVLKFAGDGVKEVQWDSKGNLYIEITMSVPKKLSKKEKSLFSEIAKEKKLELKMDEGLLGKIFS
jgi:molecular chaperone DnaJ